jgi:hypothetical protein
MYHLKYSEAKRLVKLLHTMGWKKMKHTTFYQKRWHQNGLMVSRMISFGQLGMANFPPTYILNDLEANAHQALNQAQKRRNLFGRP